MLGESGGSGKAVVQQAQDDGVKASVDEGKAGELGGRKGGDNGDEDLSRDDRSA